MQIRQMIKIDPELCNGCGLCAQACHEGAIVIQDGKARLIRDDYCDGLGNCLPACPTGAITFEMREAAPFDAEAVKAHMARSAAQPDCAQGGGCPGSRQSDLRAGAPAAENGAFSAAPTQLNNFPVQLQLVAPNASFFKGADLLVAADCAAYTMGDFHRRFMRGRVTLIGCPKLDEADYAMKLAEILRENDIRSLTVVRMEVPCCGGLARAAEKAYLTSGKGIPFQTLTLTVKGDVQEA